MSNEITSKLKLHYEECFEKFGATSQGVDWGEKEENLLLRYEKMAELIESSNNIPTILDVGCGFGGFHQYLKSKNIKVKYTGIDVAKNMIDYANSIKSEDQQFIYADFLEYQLANKYDYVICNGILTQKLNSSNIEMDQFANTLIKKMFLSSNKGIAFNIMTTKVNFFSNNLYYRSPSELLTFCFNELSSKVKIDHSYLYEYTTYIYK